MAYAIKCIKQANNQIKRDDQFRGFILFQQYWNISLDNNVETEFAQAFVILLKATITIVIIMEKIITRRDHMNMY